MGTELIDGTMRFSLFIRKSGGMLPQKTLEI